MFESIAAFWAEYGNVLTDGVWDTLVMVVISTAFAYPVSYTHLTLPTTPYV